MPTDSATDEFQALAPAPRWSFKQRLILAVSVRLAPWLIRLLGATYRIELPNGLPAGVYTDPPEPAIYVFWHRELLPIAWFARGRGFGILVSQHFDGEWIARAAARLGYRLFRGSSTRGGAGALAEMTTALLAGQPIGLTVDGPRGPRFRAKSGAVQLARATGAPIYAIHAAPARAKTLRSWDRFQIPLPFSRVRGTWAGPMYVRDDPGGDAIEAARIEMERMLNALRAAAGSDEG